MKQIKYIIGSIILMILCVITVGTNQSYAISDTRLQQLTILPEGTGLSPAFSADSYQYEMTVESDVTSVQVNAVANNAANQVQVIGADDLEEGSNLVKIKVIAENGESSSYSIFVTRKSPSLEEGNLIPNVIEENPNKELEVTGIILDEESNLFIHPEYQPQIHDYTLQMKGQLTSLPLTVVANKENANITIQGNENLTDGKNVIHIKVEYQNTQLQYQITVYKNVEAPGPIEERPKFIKEEENKKRIKQFILAIAGIVILDIIVAWIRKAKTNKGKTE